MSHLDPTPPPEDPKPPSPATDRGVSPIAGRLGGRQGKVVTLAAVSYTHLTLPTNREV